MQSEIRCTLLFFMAQLAGVAVYLEFCGSCKDLYTKWKHRPRPQCDCDNEGADACPIMCISPDVLPAHQLEHVQSKSSAERLSEGKKLTTVKIDETARQRLIRGWESRKKSWQESIREEKATVKDVVSLAYKR